MKVLEGGVTLAKGFMAASAQAGIKYQGRNRYGSGLYKKNLRCLQEPLQPM